MSSLNYLREALLPLDYANRRGLMIAARNKVNSDSDGSDPLAPVWFAIYAQIVDLDTEQTELLDQLEKDLR
ncbi:MAG: hypothetical protein ACSLFP_16315 [Acidimicrobiales bacterium]